MVDEAYAQFAEWTALDLVDDEVPLAVVRTFSKTWSMAAARLGYLVGPTWLVAALEQVALPYHLDAVKQIAGRLALDHVDEMDARIHYVVAERTSRRGAGAAGGRGVPEWANFVLFRTSAVPAGQVWQSLVDQGVHVRDCTMARVNGLLRVTIGTPEEDDRFLVALRNALGTVRS